MSTARLFFALWPDAATRRALSKTCRRLIAYCGARPVPPRYYHLTLAFLGSVPVELLPAIRTAAAGVAAPALDLELDRFGSFSRAGALWIGPSVWPAALPDLATALWVAVEPLGLRPGAGAFRPHLTVGRKLRRPPADQRPRPLRWRVGRFVLVQSVTAPAGARYTIDQYFPQGSSSEL